MKTLRIFSLSSLFTLIAAAPARAMCPVCTAAALSGVGLARWLKIDDLITGLWIGGMTVSFIGWTLSYLRKKEIFFKGQGLAVTAFFYLTLFLPLYQYEIITHPGNRYIGRNYIGIDKLVIGIIFGSLIFLATHFWYLNLKRKNNNHAYFPFQKIVMPIGALIISSLVGYLITKQ